jgi:hypothetical protein
VRLSARTVSVGSQPVTVEFKERQITGIVKWTDGTVVDAGTFTITLANGQVSNVPLSNTGTYSFNTYSEGGFNIKISDGLTGLTGTGSGSITPATDVLVVNVTMQPTGSVTGKLLDANGQALAGVAVNVTSTGQDRKFVETTDAAGRYRVPHLAYGNVLARVAVKACPLNQPYSELCELITQASGTATINEGSQAVVIDLQMPPGATVRGRMVLSDGTYVERVEPVALASKVGNLYVTYVGTTQPDGSYAFVDALPGVVTVGINASGVTGNSPAVLSAQATSTAVAGQETIVNLAPVVVYTQGGYYYGWGSSYTLGNLQIHCLGEVGEGSSYNPIFALGPANFPGYLCNSPAGLSAGGRQLDFPAMIYADSKISRKIFVEPNDRFARVYDEFENTTAATITLNVAVSTRLSGTELASLASTQGRYRAVDYSGSNAASMVFCGASPQTGCPATTSSDAESVAWTITLAPGEKRAVINYVVKAADSRSNALAAGIEPNMFDALSADERARVINFTISP